MHVGQFICKYFQKRPGAVTLYTIALLGYPVGIVVLPALLAKIMDHMKNGSGFSEWRWLLFFIIVSFLFLLACYMININVDAYITTDIQSHVRERVFRAIMESNSYRYRSLPVSNVISKTLKLPQSIFKIVTFWREQALPGIATLAAIIGYFFYLDWRMGLLLLGISGFIALLMYVSTLVCLDSTVAADYRHDRIHEHMGDAMDNLLHIYLSGAVDDEVDRLNAEHNDFLKNVRGTRQNANHFTGIMQVILGLCAAGLVVFAWRRYQAGVFSIEKLVGLLFVLMTARTTIFIVLTSWPDIIDNTGMLQKMGRYLSILETRAKIGQAGRTALPPPVTCDMQKNVLVFDDVSFRYPKTPGREHRWIFRHASCAFDRDMRVRITGKIGCGKSTLALLVLGLHTPVEGVVMLCQHDVKALARKDLSTLVSYVPQNPRLLDRTVAENITLGTDLTDEDVRRGLQDLGLDFARPDTPAGKDGSNFSTGQRVSLYLLRALLRDAPVLICDEVTANLDHKSRSVVLNTLERVSKNRVLLFITHNKSLQFPFTHDLEVDGKSMAIKPSAKAHLKTLGE